MSRLSTIRARAQGGFLLRNDRAGCTCEACLIRRDVLVLCDIAEAAERVAAWEDFSADYADDETLLEHGADFESLRAALSRLGSPEGASE